MSATATLKRERSEEEGDLPSTNGAAKVARTDAAPSGAGSGAGAGAGAGSDPVYFSAEPAYRAAALDKFKADQESCEQMIPIIGNLYRKENVVVVIYGRSLVTKSSIDIVKAHTFARQHFSDCVNIQWSLKLLQALTRVSVRPMKFDVGRASLLLKDLLGGGAAEADLEKALVSKIAVGMTTMVSTRLTGKPRDVVLYGFGRIGRLLARVLIEKTGAGSKLMLRAIVVREKPDDLRKRFSLFVQDSVHGSFYGDVHIDAETRTMVANGTVIQLIYANKPSEVDYTKYGINDAVILDNTGIWRDKAGLSQHLRCPGASKVILTAPGKGVTSVVAGVNYDRIADDIDVYAAASCTTNAIVPLLKVMDEEFTIENGHMETVHSYTNDQNLIDNYHKKNRRGRSAALNMVLTETGAAKAVAQSLPHMAGKLTGNAIRVPTPCVSMVILMLNLRKKTTATELNEFLFKEATFGKYYHQIGYSTEKDAVSSDFVGTRSSGVVDSQATIAAGNRVNLYVWYDNEFGYACQVIRLLQKVCHIEFPTYPPFERE